YLATDRGLARSGRTPRLFTRASDPRIYSVYRDRDGSILAGCGQEFCRLRGDQLVPVEPALPPAGWTNIRRGPNGDLWLLNGNSIWVRSAKNGRFESLPGVPPGANPFAAFIGDPALTIAGDGSVLVSTPAGLARWHNHEWQFIGRPSGLGGEDVTALFADREGSIWIGISGLGLSRWLGYSEWQSWG